MADGGLSTIASTIGVSVKLLQTIYEVKAVTEKTESLLNTTTLVLHTLESSKRLRRQKSGLLETAQKRWMDNEVFPRSMTAISSVIGLISRARMDRAECGDRVRVRTKLRFVLMDSPNVQEKLHEMNIVYTALTAALTQLSSLRSSSDSSQVIRRISSAATVNTSSNYDESIRTFRTNGSNPDTLDSAPPPYNESELPNPTTPRLVVDASQEQGVDILERDMSSDGWTYPISYTNVEQESRQKDLPPIPPDFLGEATNSDGWTYPASFTKFKGKAVEAIRPVPLDSTRDDFQLSPLTDRYDSDLSWSYTSGVGGTTVRYCTFGSSRSAISDTATNSAQTHASNTSNATQQQVRESEEIIERPGPAEQEKCAGLIWLEREDSIY